MSSEYADAKKVERTFESRIDSIGRAITQSETAYAEDRRDYQAHLDAAAAGEIFRKLDPSCCPRCDAAVTEERRKQESTKKACSVCGGKIAADENVEAQKDVLKSRVDASKGALDAAKREQKFANEGLEKTQAEIKALDRQIATFTKKLEVFDVRKRLEIEVAVLEARLTEASHDPEPEVSNEDEKTIIDAIVVETDDRIKNTQVDLLKDVSDQLTIYAQKFGMEMLTQAQLKGNMNLTIVKGGQQTSYSKVTEGEKLRLKVATVLAMIRVAEKKGVGRHPGLLMIDSPGAQEVAPEDREHLIAGLDDISKELAHLQVFVASIASADILKHIPKKRMRLAVGHDPLW